MVTHNQDEAMLMADRIAVMNNGQVEQYATPRDIYDQPATPFVAEFVGQGNWLPFQRSSDSHAQVGAMSMRLAPGSAMGRSGRLFCRPEAITVNPAMHEENLFPARVREITFLGNRCRMSFELKALPGHALLAELAPRPCRAWARRTSGWHCRRRVCRCSPKMAAPMPLPLSQAKAAPRAGVALGDRLFVVGGKSLLLILLVLAVLMPLLAIFWRGFSAEAGQGGGLLAARELFASANFHWLLGNSLSVAITVAVMVVPLAYLFAYALQRTLIPAKGLWRGFPCCRCWRRRCCQPSPWSTCSATRGCYVDCSATTSTASGASCWARPSTPSRMR